MNIVEQAKTAFKAGLTLSDNPYPVGTREYSRWRSTWQRAALYFDWRGVPHPMDRFLRSATEVTRDAASVAAVLEVA